MTDPKNKPALVTQFMEAMPYSKALKLKVESAEPGELVVSMPYSDQLVGDPETGVIHGGAVSALMDTTCGGAVMAHPKTTLLTATLDLRIDYMRPAKPGHTITTRATCYHVTRSVAFARAVAYDDDPDRPVATATGAFTVEQSK